MIRVLPIVLAFALASCAPPPPMGQQGPDSELVGRVTGAPEHCVPIISSQNLRVSDSDPHLMLYGYGRVIWVTSLGPGCSFRRDDIPVTEPTGSSYCRGDLVRSIDRISHIPGPTCVFGDFVPYRRP